MAAANSAGAAKQVKKRAAPAQPKAKAARRKPAAAHAAVAAVMAPGARRERDIADHGAIGNLETIALVACDGTIDYLCWPNLDSPSIFAGLLDADQGGVFELAPELSDVRIVQMYLPDTNVLLTKWLGTDGSAEITDLMLDTDEEEGGPTRLVRRVKVTRGTVTVRLRCAPRLDYGRVVPTVIIENGCAIAAAADGIAASARWCRRSAGRWRPASASPGPLRRA